MTTEMAQAIDACAQMVARADGERFQAVMAAPLALRDKLLVLYAFNLEVARIPWVTKEPMLAEMRLQWWRDVLETAQDPSAPLPAHEVAGPLAVLVGQGRVDVGVADALIEARRQDISAEPFGSEAEFDAYLEATGGGLLWLAAKACGAPAVAEGAVRDYGWALGLANYLRAVPELEERGRWPLLDGRAEAISALAGRGLARIAQARRARATLPRCVRPVMLAGWQAEKLLRQAQLEPARVAEGELMLSEFQRRGGLIWQMVSGRW